MKGFPRIKRKSASTCEPEATRKSEPFPEDLPTYLGAKGYTVPKANLTPAQLATLKDLLTARPIQSMGYGAPGEATGFPIYRESPKKMYMPRYFGEDHFGPVKAVELGQGDALAADVVFQGTLREAQVPAVEAYLNHVGHGGGADGLHPHAGGLLELSCAAGKTVMSLYILAQLRRKTLIIVNKEFLLNQWIERIQEFLPAARVGRIQGAVVDVSDKDIVIGMLQSLSMKEYPAATFAGFGLTIVDEVHHISSEVFSCALFRIVTRYMLGLSATMERKDGTTNVIKMFLGEVVYRNVSAGGHDVLVRAMEYRHPDPEFQETEVDWRGQPQYSRMITKLCGFRPRSDFIVRVVGDLVQENPESQIMVLAHNRSLLVYLYETMAATATASVGYYLGGMKQADLQASETKQVILGTYAIAAEALDIKTLSTLILATPKTDIVQCVGRILRTKHRQPIVVDVVDMHSVFQNQWQKRRVYYKKCGYDVRMIDSPSYRGMKEGTAWRQVHRPRGCHSADAEEGSEEKKGVCMIDVGALA